MIHEKHCCRSKEELISDIFSWILAHGPTSKDLFTSALYRLRIQPRKPRAMYDRDGWSERVRESYAVSAT